MIQIFCYISRWGFSFDVQLLGIVFVLRVHTEKRYGWHAFAEGVNV